jgi:dipeptidyl aminopeptidase/acylaminoacyl peptidase
MNDKQLTRVVVLLIVLGSARSTAVRAEEPGDPLRPAAINTSGAPIVPPEIVRDLEAYQNVRAAGFAGWDPAGKGMLVRTRFANSTQLHRVYTSGGRREQLTFADEPVSGYFIPDASDGAIVASMNRGGSEDHQLYLREPRSGRLVLLTDGKSRNSQGPFSPDGRGMVVQSNRRNGKDMDLYLADPRRPDSMKMLHQADGAYWYATDWSEDGGQIAMVQYVSINETHPAVLDVKTRQATPLATPKLAGDASAAAPLKVSFGNLRFAPDGESLYLTSDAQGEFHQLARYDSKTGQYQWLTQDIPWDVTAVEVDSNSGAVAFTANENGASRLYLLEGGHRRKLELPLGIVHDLEFSPDGSRLGFALYQPDAPGDVYDIRLQDGELTRWTYSELGGLDPRRFIEPTRIEYPTFDKRRIPAYYYRPQLASVDSPAPVLIRIHGGPEGQYRPYFSGSDQYFAGELGVAVIWPNVRGSEGYGKSYLKLDNGMLREDSVRDIGALLDWIDKQPELDSKRVMVAGGSYGGYMVLASLTHYSDRLAAGIDWVGIANFTTFLENTRAYRRDLRRVEYGDERDPAMRAFFEKINPTANADKIDAALLVIHGVNDPRVPFSEAEQIAEKVEAQGKDVWTVYAENEGHGFSKKDNRDYARAVEVMFIKKYLGIE